MSDLNTYLLSDTESFPESNTSILHVYDFTIFRFADRVGLRIITSGEVSDLLFASMDFKLLAYRRNCIFAVYGRNGIVLGCSGFYGRIGLEKADFLTMRKESSDGDEVSDFG